MSHIERHYNYQQVAIREICVSCWYLMINIIINKSKNLFTKELPSKTKERCHTKKGTSIIIKCRHLEESS